MAQAAPDWPSKGKEQLENTEQVTEYDPKLICHYCNRLLIDADYTKWKFGFRGWSKKDQKYKYFCWSCF